MVKIDKKSWQIGYLAGYKKEPNVCPVELDKYSFSSGYIEGKVEKLKNGAKGKIPFVCEKCLDCRQFIQ